MLAVFHCDRRVMAGQTSIWKESRALNHPRRRRLSQVCAAHALSNFSGVAGRERTGAAITTEFYRETPRICACDLILGIPTPGNPGKRAKPKRGPFRNWIRDFRVSFVLSRDASPPIESSSARRRNGGRRMSFHKANVSETDVALSIGRMYRSFPVSF